MSDVPLLQKGDTVCWRDAQYVVTALHKWTVHLEGARHSIKIRCLKPIADGASRRRLWSAEPAPDESFCVDAPGMSPIATRVALTYRVAQRFLTARGIPVGKTYQDEGIRIHRYRDVLVITDLTNAGKRGKSCGQIRVEPTADFEGDRDSGFDEITEGLLNHAARGGYQAVREYVTYLQHDRRGQFGVNYEQLKSISVEPFGEIFEFEIKQPGKASIEVKASPIDFSVINHAWMKNQHDPEKGFIQDTRYWPRKKKDAMAFYAWMKENHERARRFMSIDMFRQTWKALGVTYDSH